jgi:hypothetical protein
VESGHDLVAVGVADLVEDAQRLRPGPAGRLGVACAVLDVAETGEAVSFVEPVGEVPVEADRLLVAPDGPLLMTEVMVNEAEAVPGGRLPAALAQRTDGRQALLALGDGLLVVAEPGLAEADVVEDHGLARPVPGGPVQLEGAGGVPERISEALLPLGDPGQAAVYAGLADVVANRFELGESALEAR